EPRGRDGSRGLCGASPGDRSPGTGAGSPDPGQEDPEHLPDPSGLSLPGRTAPDPQREVGLPYLGGLGCGTGGASIKPVLLVKIAYRKKAAAQRAAAFCGMEAGSSS